MSSISGEFGVQEGKRFIASKIATSVSSGGSPIRVINAFIQVKDYQGLDRYLSKQNISKDILTSCLQRACINSDIEAVQIFSNHGANVKYVDQFGTTMLHFAMRGGGNATIIRTLIENGMDFHLWKSEGMSLLHWACSIGMISLVE